MGIGQANLIDYRYRIVDYLPAMYMYEYIMASKKPKEIATYTNTYPFDSYSRLCIICSIFAVFLTLILAQNLWSFMQSSSNPDDYIYEGYLLTSRLFITQDNIITILDLQTYFYQVLLSQEENSTLGFKDLAMAREKE